VRIFHPRPQMGRQKFIGVEFRDGVADVAELHPERRTALLMHGYTIEDDAPESVNLPELSVAELREIARFEGVELPTRAKKADIIAALEEQRREVAATPAEIETLNELAAELRESAQAATIDQPDDAHDDAKTDWPRKKATDFAPGA